MSGRHAPGWATWPACWPAGDRQLRWRWRAWGDACTRDGVAGSRAEAAELAQRAERSLCGPRRALAALPAR